MTDIKEVKSFIFSSGVDSQPPSLTDESVENFLKRAYSGKFTFSQENLKKEGLYKILGHAFDFRPFLKKFVYKQYGSWSEMYAPNKTLLRKSTFGKIDTILEIK